MSIDVSPANGAREKEEDHAQASVGSRLRCRAFLRERLWRRPVWWRQWGQNSLHQGFVPIGGQTGSHILANIVYDPFVSKEQSGPYAAGDLLVHYQTPLI